MEEGISKKVNSCLALDEKDLAYHILVGFIKERLFAGNLVFSKTQICEFFIEVQKWVCTFHAISN